MVKSKLFKTEYATELLGIADNDLVAARALRTASGVRPETTLLMVQQSIEKSLKALLCHRGQAVPQTHDLDVLIDRIGQAGIALPALLVDSDFGDLSNFATLRRYEEGRGIIGPEELEAALELAEEVLIWVRGAIKKP